MESYFYNLPSFKTVEYEVKVSVKSVWWHCYYVALYYLWLTIPQKWPFIKKTHQLKIVTESGTFSQIIFMPGFEPSTRRTWSEHLNTTVLPSRLFDVLKI